MIPRERIIAVVSPDSAPVKRMISSHKSGETVIDATQGRKTKSVIVLEGGYLALSYLQPETVAGRIEDKSEDKNMGGSFNE